MGEFTLRVDEVADFVGGKSAIIQHCLSSYPCIDEKHRASLNNKILDHYWLRDIGAETIEVWYFYMRRTMNEIMPYYNQLLETERIEFDPLSTFNWVDAFKSDSTNDMETDGTSTTDTTNKTHSTSKTVNMTFPSTGLSGNGNYASSGSEVFGDTDADTAATGATTEKVTGKGTNETTRTMKGQSGSPSALLMEYRRTILNVDLMILDELEPCFFQLWSNGDSPLKRGYGYDSFAYYAF